MGGAVRTNRGQPRNPPGSGPAQGDPAHSSLPPLIASAFLPSSDNAHAAILTKKPGLSKHISARFFLAAWHSSFCSMGVPGRLMPPSSSMRSSITRLPATANGSSCTASPAWTSICPVGGWRMRWITRFPRARKSPATVGSSSRQRRPQHRSRVSTRSDRGRARSTTPAKPSPCSIAMAAKWIRSPTATVVIGRQAPTAPARPSPAATANRPTRMFQVGLPVPTRAGRRDVRTSQSAARHPQ